MRRMFRHVLIAAVLVVIPFSSVLAEPVPPVFTERETWFHGTSTKVTNIDARNGVVPTWDGTKPTASHPYGAGSVYLANQGFAGSAGQNADGFSAKGKFTGDIENWAVTLYGYLPTNKGLPCGMSLAYDLKIDGTVILDQKQSAPSNPSATTEAVNDDLYRVRFALTNIYKAMQDSGLETGPGIEHTIELTALNFYLCQEAVWVYDSAEAPAGSTFNLLDSKRLRAYTKVDVLNPPPPLQS